PAHQTRPTPPFPRNAGEGARRADGGQSLPRPRIEKPRKSAGLFRFGFFRVAPIPRCAGTSPASGGRGAWGQARRLAIAAPRSPGERTVVTPAFSIAANLPSAVPEPPEAI